MKRAGERDGWQGGRRREGVYVGDEKAMNVGMAVSKVGLMGGWESEREREWGLREGKVIQNGLDDNELEGSTAVLSVGCFAFGRM